jgi:pimeloyl-ACP methyl ester carboxylesterase
MMPFQKAFLNSPELGRNLSIAGCTVHYHEQGQGLPLVLLHGLGFSLYTFRGIIPLLSDYYRVISLDLPGCGYSKGLPGEGSVEDMADVLHAFIDSVAAGEAVSLLGAAEGGIYALALYQKYPDRIAALALESPGSLTRYYPWQWQHLLTPIVGEWLIRRMSQRDFELILRRMHFDETMIHESEVHQFVQLFEDAETRHNLLLLLRRFDSRDVFDRLGSIRIPVCLLWGDSDQCHPAAMSALYRKGIPDCQYRVLRNCGHLAHEERPGEFAESVHAFLANSLRRWRPYE